MRELRSLPKAHLHLHLDGAVRPSTYAELAAEAGLPAPLPSSYESFAEFLDTITAVGRVLRTPDQVCRVVRELVEDAAASGAVWVQPSVWPGLFDGRLGDDGDALDLLLEAGRSAAAEFGVGFGLIVAVNRGAGPEAALSTARLAAARAKAGVIGLGLDGDEKAFSTRDFVPAFDIAQAAGIDVLPHAGELAGADSVWEALDLLAADGVLHGVRSLDDPKLVKRLARTGTPLHVCPTSNAVLSAVPSLAEHPLPALLAAGVRCTVNADDPALFGTDLLTEYERCRSVLGLSDEQLADVARTSVRSSAAPDMLKRAALRHITEWIAT